MSVTPEADHGTVVVPNGPRERQDPTGDSSEFPVLTAGIADQYDRFQGSLEQLGRERKYLNYGYTTHRRQSYQDRQERLCLEVFKAARVTPDHRIVDVGFGSGEQDFLWARSASFRHLHGFNISPAQVRYARQRAQQEGLEARLTFSHGEAERLPGLERGSIDRLLAVECAFYFRRDEFYRRAAEILVPGGLLVAADICFADLAHTLTSRREDLERVGTLSHNRALWEQHFATEEIRPIQRFTRPGAQRTVWEILRTVPRSSFNGEQKREWLSMALWSQLVALGLLVGVLRYDLIVLRRLPRAERDQQTA